MRNKLQGRSAAPCQPGTVPARPAAMPLTHLQPHENMQTEDTDLHIGIFQLVVEPAQQPAECKLEESS